MYTIMKAFTLCAAHHLDGLPEGHQCARNHGHNYQVRLYLRRPALDLTGFVADFGLLSASFGTYLQERFDHQDLNARVAFNPTAENLAEALYHVAERMFPGLTHAVRVYETPDCYAEYKEGG